VHVDRAVWRASAPTRSRSRPPGGVGRLRHGERAALELAECYVFIHDEGIPDEVYDRVGGILSEEEYVALSWLLVSINAFNRITIAASTPCRRARASASTAPS
jgi:alkylhydroperoxidase family enzyme